MEFFKFEKLHPTTKAPFFDVFISAGFPSPAQDFEETRISFDEEVFGTSPSTIFCAKVSGNSMINAGIEDGDIIAINRILKAQDGDICVAVINNDFTLKRLRVEKNCVLLMPENDNYKPILVNDNEGFEIWGIVTHTLKNHRKKRR
ncbi:translesion error-prone DNA polymerase V autoproteolytic subunit [Flavobacterium salilacus subsp. salilacus]|uniref:LexA family protein n=1 Tax=Flavobacterium TaxID=237 RepID=UPI0010755EED|nr:MULTISPECIES: translesion error-prone DNA polymerase V autoproteolytic subunit [Flavobacterium]KAF2520049.1 translesion error-prone DNA polymerase V autoproteolytic subunit [Flavobacterium salilacus subsp. salilacus]MBE1614035.1 translesion error-prone DNA polymerase V autoproteolytic subunit [Flavobacterium sp. SaA2.13]